jgi:glutathione S-transferase
MQDLETLLSKQEYLIDNNFSLADVAVSSYLLFVPQFFRDIQFHRCPNVVKYMLRCASREGYGKAYSLKVQNFVVTHLKNMSLSIPKEKKLFGML